MDLYVIHKSTYSCACEILISDSQVSLAPFGLEKPVDSSALFLRGHSHWHFGLVELGQNLLGHLADRFQLLHHLAAARGWEWDLGCLDVFFWRKFSQDVKFVLRLSLWQLKQSLQSLCM